MKHVKDLLVPKEAMLTQEAQPAEAEAGETRDREAATSIRLDGEAMKEGGEEEGEERIEVSESSAEHSNP